MNNDQFLTVDNLEVIYSTDEGICYAVNGISFSLKRGETLGFLGETGAGKTTTALSLLRLLPERTSKILSGDIQFKGQNVLELKKGDLRALRGGQISMIFQDPMTSLNPILTIGEQVEESLILHNDKLSSKELSERVDDILNLVGISPSRKGEYPHQFSGGMKQRVVIAMALSCQPELVIADEPTTALDVTIQAQVLRMMLQLKERLGTSMIIITHDLGVIANTCDRVAVFYAGEIIEYGTLSDLFGPHDHHPYTIGLFNSVPDIQASATRLHPIEGLMPDPMNLPSGCNFHPRCHQCSELCIREAPPIYDRDGHGIKCHLFAPR